MSTSMTHGPGYTEGVLPVWATEWDTDEYGDSTPIRPIVGEEIRLEPGADGQPVIYTSYAFVAGSGHVEPSKARELAAALFEAADILQGGPSIARQVATVIAGLIEERDITAGQLDAIATVLGIDADAILKAARG